MALKDYCKLREQLLLNKEWPMPYMFKFIAPNTDGKVDKVIAFLPKDVKLTFKYTKNLKHVAISCVAQMSSADDIIIILDRVASIQGVISL